MTVHEKDGKPPRTGAAPAPPTAKKGVGGARPNPDVEELSGSLLIDEAGKAPTFVAGSKSAPPATVQKSTVASPKASHPAPAIPTKSAAPRPPSVAPKASIPAPLPRPNPPPKLEDRRSEPRPPPAPSDGDAGAERLETTDFSDQMVTRVQPALQPPPTPPEDTLSDDDVELTALPESMLSPWKAAFHSALRGAVALGQKTAGVARQAPSIVRRASSLSIVRRASSLVEQRPALNDLLRKRGLLVIAGCGLLAGVGLVALTISAARRHRDAQEHTMASAVAEVTSPAPSESPTAAAAEGAGVKLAPAPTPAAPCRVAGDPRLVGQSATVTVGVEARAAGAEVALGFAPNEHQAVLLRLNPTSASALESTQTKIKDSIVRVTPVPGKAGRFALAVDVDRQGDALEGRRAVPFEPPIQVGMADGHLAWAPLNRGVAGTLWPLEGGDPVDALRGARSESNPSTVAIALRRSGAIWVGTAEGAPSLAPKGELSRLQGLGQVGSPAIAVNDGVVIAAWADRPSPDAPWHLRWVRFKVGEQAGAPNDFAAPAGGKGDQIMSPSLAVAPGGHFVLVWTEGPATSHEVRALTLSGDGSPLGPPLDISRESSNAGQGQAAIASAGRGVVAFLRANGGGFQVLATPIECPL